jgi:hypothetical protein
VGADVLCRINGHSASRLDELLPWIWKVGLPDWLHKRCLRGGSSLQRRRGRGQPDQPLARW